MWRLLKLVTQDSNEHEKRYINKTVFFDIYPKIRVLYLRQVCDTTSSEEPVFVLVRPKNPETTNDNQMSETRSNHIG
jgi:hypothetical protein